MLFSILAILYTIYNNYTNQFETTKNQNFRFILEQIDSVFLYIHKIQIRTTINKEHYNELKLHIKGKAKYHLERINQAQGKPDTEYNIFSNGTVMVYTACSDNPFRLYNDDDILKILSFLGRVEDRLKILLDDTRGGIVSHVLTWILTACDVNKDIEIGEMAQLTSINIQIKSAIGVFRSYVKQLKNKSVNRNEISLEPNESLATAFDSLKNNIKIDKGNLLSSFSSNS